jgi:aminoglycoside/choline kinase family phosphotransferase
MLADLTRAGNFTVLLEDLGDETLFLRLQRTPRDQWLPWYERAVDLLVDWQRAFATEDPACVAYGRHFDYTLLRWELDHFREWGLDAFRAPVAPALRTALDAEFDSLATAVCALPTTMPTCLPGPNGTSTRHPGCTAPIDAGRP